VRFTLPELFPSVIVPFVAAQPFSPLCSTKVAVEELNFLAAAPGLVNEMVIDQFLYFFEESVVENELSWAYLVLPLHEVTGPIFNVPDKAPLTTKELVVDAETLTTRTIIETDDITNKGTATRATFANRWMANRFGCFARSFMHYSFSEASNID
jgi:hypothetical protein